MDLARQLVHAREVGLKTGMVLQKRLENARETYSGRVQQAVGNPDASPTEPMAEMDPMSGYAYAIDSMQLCHPVLGHAKATGQQFCRKHHAGPQAGPVFWLRDRLG
ncbi:hypothetical protein [Cupriavidus lacunae]|uniref:hypothetical protein n=1 Tax=Cupriavidus lacunae TaxID=2666307 RepID=UPI003CC6552B